jgi:hypothetical protein
MITHEYIREFFSYNKETGDFRRIKRKTWKGNIMMCDREIKSKTAYGYLQVNVEGKPRLVHRLIWLWMTGDWPENDIDHVNGVRTDNRWSNLREATRGENLRNIGIKSNNTSGHLGISKRSDTGAWHAYIDYEGVRTHLGNFATIEEAIEVRKQAEEELGFHCNHGKREAWRG